MTTQESKESKLRDSATPWPKTETELSDYILSLVEQEHDYGSCVYAMSLAAVAAFNYVADRLGATGFQSSCADLDFIKRIRHIKGPFMILDVADELYSSDACLDKAREYVQKSRVWLRKMAKERIAEGGYFAPDVFHRLMELAAFAPCKDEDVKTWNQQNPNDPITGTDWHDKNRSDMHENGAKLAFLREMGGYFPSEEFVESRVADFKRFGFDYVSLLEGDITKTTKAEDGASFRLGMPVSIGFSRELDGLKITWNTDTEIDSANGSSRHQFDFAKLEAMRDAAQWQVHEYLEGYISRAIAASAPEPPQTPSDAQEGPQRAQKGAV